MATVWEAKQTCVARFISLETPGVLAPLAISVQPQFNVTAVGIGAKLVNGKPVGSQCVRIYVEKKVPETGVPPQFRLPKEIDGVPTDIIESGAFVAGGGLTPAPAGAAITPGPVVGRFRPARGGCSCGFVDPVSPGNVMAGTLGVFVQNGNRTCILSNNHVLAAENGLPIGRPIFQPGLMDGGNILNDQIAQLTAFIPIDPAITANLDCAIAEMLNPATADAVLLPGVGQLSSSVPIAALETMKVEKVGRTTGYTQGEVFDVDATVKVRYSFGIAAFDNQVLVRGTPKPFSMKGDSGSLIVDRDTKRGTALLFAGADEFSAGNKLDDVLTALGATLII